MTCLGPVPATPQPKSFSDQGVMGLGMGMGIVLEGLLQRKHRLRAGRARIRYAGQGYLVGIYRPHAVISPRHAHCPPTTLQTICYPAARYHIDENSLGL